MATCSVPDIDVDQSSGSQADRGGRWRLTDLGVRPLNVYDELTYEFTWCGQMGDRSRLGIIWIGCQKSFSSYRRSSENDSSLPLFFPTDERDCTKDFYSVNIKIYKMSASPQQQTSDWKWKLRNDRRSERNLCNCVKKPEKHPGLQRGLNPWPRDTSAMLYQLSYEATDVAFTATIICSFSLFHFISAVHIWFISLSLTNQWVVPGLPVVDLDQYN